MYLVWYFVFSEVYTHVLDINYLDLARDNFWAEVNRLRTAPTISRTKYLDLVRDAFCAKRNALRTAPGPRFPGQSTCTMWF